MLTRLISSGWLRILSAIFAAAMFLCVASRASAADNVLYSVTNNSPFNIYTVDTTTGAIASTVGTVTGGGLATGLGGDISFSPTGVLYFAGGTNLYSISGTTATLVGATGVATAIAGLAFAANGSLYASETTASNSK